MSLTIFVPAAVPSLFHSSVPWTPSLAAKKSVLPTWVNELGLESPEGLMFLTRLGGESALTGATRISVTPRPLVP